MLEMLVCISPFTFRTGRKALSRPDPGLKFALAMGPFGGSPFRVSHNCRIGRVGPVRRYRNLCTVHNLQKITPVAKNFCIFLLTGSVVFGNVILDCGRFTCDCARLSCDGSISPSVCSEQEASHDELH
jgi:hypothetical protein